MKTWKRSAIWLAVLMTFILHARGHEIAQVTGDVEEMRVHVRSSLPQFGLSFSRDSVNMLSLKTKNVQQGDGNYDWRTQVVLNDSTSAEVNHSTAEFSLCVSVDAGGVRIEAGDGTRIFDGKVSVEAVKGCVVSMLPEPKTTDYVDFAVRYKPERKMSRFSSIDELTNYLDCSTDSIEGLWQWVDCNTDAPAVTAGGRYTFATIANEANGYDIVYIDGSTIGNWQAQQVKGTMRPTPFINHFDVSWLDAVGHDAGEGIYATIDADGIMTLNFTPLRSNIRLIRMTHPQHQIMQ